jgi:hypothetical protein
MMGESESVNGQFRSRKVIEIKSTSNVIKRGREVNPTR